MDMRGDLRLMMRTPVDGTLAICEVWMEGAFTADKVAALIEYLELTKRCLENREARLEMEMMP